MAETVIGPDNANEHLGAVLFKESPHPSFPGLVPKDAKVEDLARKAFELTQIRATLLLNFGQTVHNRWGILVNPAASTLDMLLFVLQTFASRQGPMTSPLLATQAPEPTKE